MSVISQVEEYFREKNETFTRKPIDGAIGTETKTVFLVSEERGWERLQGWKPSHTVGWHIHKRREKNLCNVGDVIVVMTTPRILMEVNFNGRRGQF